MTRTITVAHSPDSDDAFMFYGLARGKVNTRGLRFKHELADIETLNRKAMEGAYEVTAISFHAYYRISDKYRLMTVGASVGDGYGPILISKRPLTRQDLDEVIVGIPGELTTAFLVFRLFAPATKWKTMPFDRIQDAVRQGDIDAGLIIHEGQVTFREQGLNRIQDLGEWWKLGTGLPLPVGANALRRDLDRDTAMRCCDVLRDTIQYGLDHPAEALDYAQEYAPDLDRDRCEKFVRMYVNAFTLELGKRGEDAVELLYQLGHDAGVIPFRIHPEFIG